MTDETALYLRLKGNVICVQGRSAVIGRSASCDVQVDEQGVSRRHCEVLLRDDGATIRDLGSSRGTWVGGVRAEAEQRLAAGVLVTLGPHGTHFELVNAIVHGRPVLGAPAVAQPTVLTDLRSADAKAPATQPVVTLAPAKSRFGAGLAIGAVIGLVVGLALVAFVEF